MDELFAVKVEVKMEIREGSEALLDVDIKPEVKGEVLAEAKSGTGLLAAAATAPTRRSCRSGKGL